jgi:hypothetical protein
MAGIDYAELRRRLRLGQVLELLGFVPSTHHGNQVRGPCPVHGSQSPRSRSFAALSSHGKRTMAGLPLIAKVIP